MATSQIASMLDELMGRNRNLAPDDANARELRWSDPEVCRFHLVDFCPHDLFVNTKADLGPCGKIHDDNLKQKFQDELQGTNSGGGSGNNSNEYLKAQVVDDFLRFCQRMLSDLGSRIKKAKERLTLTQEKEDKLLMVAAAHQVPSGSAGDHHHHQQQQQQQMQQQQQPQHKDVEEKVILLSEKISALVQEAENAGCQGNVEEAQGLLKLSDQLKDEREALKRQLLPQNLNSLKDEYNVTQKAMEVCDICGAFLIVGDAQQRIDDHLLGKQHMGYAKVRAAVDRVLEDRKRARQERERELEEHRRSRRRQQDSHEARDGGDSSRRKDRDRRRSKDRDAKSSSSRSHGGQTSRKRGSSRSRSRSRSSRRDDKGAAKRGSSRDRKSKAEGSSRRSRSRQRRSSRSRTPPPQQHPSRRRSRSRSRDSRRHRGHGSNGRQRSRSKDRKRPSKVNGSGSHKERSP